MELLGNINDPFLLVIAIVGVFILLFGLVSLFVKERIYLTESFVAIFVGLIFGPKVLGIIDFNEWLRPEQAFRKFLLHVTRLIISLQVMAVGLSVPPDYAKRQWKSLFMLLGPGMCFAYGISAIIVKFVIGCAVDITWLESLMIGAALAPTDPVLAHAVIKGKFANRYIPSHLRTLLSLESSANDGLGFPFLMLPIWILTSSTSGQAMKEWFLHTWLYEIMLSCVLGAILGFIARYLLEKSEQYRLIDKESFLAYSIALALAVTGLIALISSDDILAVFICGLVFAYDGRFAQETKDAHLQEVLDLLFNMSFFVFLGSIFPWNSYRNIGIGWLILCSFLILLLRRLPFVLGFKRFIPQLKSYKEAFFCGWFGPMGVGAIFFSMVVYSNHNINSVIADRVFVVVTFNVLASIIVHGITVPITHVSLRSQAKRRLRRELRMNKDGPLRSIPESMDSGISELDEKGERVHKSVVDNIPDSEVSVSDIEDVIVMNRTSNARTKPYIGMTRRQTSEGEIIEEEYYEKSESKKSEAISIPIRREDTYASSASSFDTSKLSNV